MVAKKKKPPVISIKKVEKVEKVEKNDSDIKFNPVNPVKPVNVRFPIVGIGASAGGLAAFEAFFAGMPANKDIDMAFVLVQHLAPSHKSMLTELLQRFTTMPVFEVVDGMIVKPNCVYIIPPDRDMALINGSLQLLEPVLPRGHRFPIDFLFRSLAQDLNEHAICIILSGTGSDGTLGLREIKNAGGMVMVESLKSCEFDAMPKNAIDTGLADYQMAPVDMPAQILDHAKQVLSQPKTTTTDPQVQTESLLSKLFILLRTQTGHDFSEYKRSTINRRIERRMAANQIMRLEEYVKYMRQTPEEIDALFRDLLIGVTNFYRDPEAFAALEQVIKSVLFNNKLGSREIRVWVCGCSTGEEAYSIAIVLLEKLEKLAHNGIPSSFKVHLFASDIDKLAIGRARQGIFPESIAEDITAARLARYFIFDAKAKTYRIQKKIRDMIIFSEQNVTKDPPFSKLDLISCRNLLIYMGSTLQKKIISLFHYSLNPDGFLFLGTSETTGDMSSMFTAFDRKQKLYQRKPNGCVAGQSSSILSLPPNTDPGLSPPKVLPYITSLQELAEKALLQKVVQAGVLVNQKGDILYLHGRTGMYFEPVTGGLDSYNILKMAREGLQPELRVALYKAASDNIVVHRSGLRVKTNGGFSTVNLSVSPVTANLTVGYVSTMFMVVLEAAATQLEVSTDFSGNLSSGSSFAISNASKSANTGAQIARLEQALRDKDDFIKSANEVQQSSNEELKSANEELQSINEELQSTNEELETSKEELQAVNEELATTNSELKAKAMQSSNLNNDMNNLIVGTGIATIFVDLKLNILRFTPGVTKIISLIEADVGRPLMHFTSTLRVYDQLEQDLKSMLHSLIPREIEVQSIDSSYYMLRMLPYRTTDNRIEGAVINFINITEHRQSELSLKQANSQLRLATVVCDANDAILLQDLDGNIMAFNGAAQRLYGWSETEALTLNIAKLVPTNLQKKELSRIKQLSQKEILETYETKRFTKNGSIIDVLLTATGLINQAGEVYAIATTERHNKKSETEA
jgi:two-component system CheB/CheR fusion protein